VLAVPQRARLIAVTASQAFICAHLLPTRSTRPPGLVHPPHAVFEIKRLVADCGRVDPRRFARTPWVNGSINCSSTIIWHHDRHARRSPPLMPRRNPEDIDLGAIKADLECLTKSSWSHRHEGRQRGRAV